MLKNSKGPDPDPGGELITDPPRSWSTTLHACEYQYRPAKKYKHYVKNSVPDPDPRVFCLPDPDPLVRGMDPDPALDPDPSIVMQK